jgi:hypothetical protein
MLTENKGLHVHVHRKYWNDGVLLQRMENVGCTHFLFWKFSYACRFIKATLGMSISSFTLSYTRFYPLLLPIMLLPNKIRRVGCCEHAQGGLLIVMSMHRDIC